jgi:hypothetical protein
MLFIEIQPLFCFRGKMCSKLEKWDPLMGSHPVRETVGWGPVFHSPLITNID